MLMTFIKEYSAWKKEHKTEVARAKLRREILKTPINYTLLEEYLNAFIEQNNRDLVLDIEGSDYKIKVYYDIDKNAYTHKSVTKQIVEAYK